jgi:DNA-binding MarR family transcriptional regulator
MRKRETRGPAIANPDSPSRTPIPPVGEGKRGETGHLGYLLRQAAGGFRLRLDRDLADVAVTSPQFVVMTMIAAYPGLSNADLARLSMLTPQTISVIIANLLRAETVIRRHHAVHGRIQQLELTEAGQALLAKCRTRVELIEAQLSAGLSPREEAGIRRWLVAAALLGGAAPSASVDSADRERDEEIG